MKTTRFNTTDASNVPQKLSLVDPFTGETLLDDDGKTIDFYVYGMQSDNARNAIKVRERKHGKQSKLTDEQAAQSGAEFLAAITQGWSSNLPWLYDDDVKEKPFSREAAIELYKVEDWIARQVQQFSMDLGNYDPKRSSGFASGPATSPGSTQRPKRQTEPEGSN